MKTWLFVTTWIRDGRQDTRRWSVCATDQLYAHKLYCQLVWVQDLNYDEFESLTITIER
jgi:hypothetical protein